MHKSLSSAVTAALTHVTPESRRTAAAIDKLERGNITLWQAEAQERETYPEVVITIEAPGD